MTADRGRLVVVAGATGLTGREIVTTLLGDRTVDMIHSLPRQRRRT